MNGYTLGLAAHPLVVLAIIAAAFAFAIYTYRRTSPPVSAARRWTLIALRTIGVGLLLLALFEPVLTSVGVTAEDPSVIVAIDNSASMTLPGSDSTRIAEARAIARRLATAGFSGGISFLGFSDSSFSVHPPFSSDSLAASGVATRMESPLARISDTLRRRNVRAVVMLSDGRHNEGANPLFPAEALGLPVFAVGLGDSVPPRDLSIQQVLTNEVAFVDAQLPVEVRLRSSGFDGGSVTVTLREDGAVVRTQQIALAGGPQEYTASFLWKPRREGMARLEASVEAASGELTTKNNARSTYVRVRSDKRSYVMLAGGPGPDVAFLRRQLESEEGVTLTTLVQKPDGSFLGGGLNAQVLAESEGLVLVNFPTSSTPPAVVELVRAAVSRGNAPLFLVLGSSVDYGRLRPLEPYLPVTFGTGRDGEMAVQLDLTAQGRTSPITTVPEMGAWESLPPIYRSETPTQARGEAEVLATARLGGTPLGEPLIVSRRLGRTRSLAVLGWGIYRWQLLGEGTAAMRGVEGPGLLSAFVQNATRWLAAANDERQVRIAASKQLYNAGERVRLHAQVYDESNEPISNAQVPVALQGPKGSRSITLSPAGNGRYEGTISGLAAGEYAFAGRAVVAGREIGSDAGRFAVGEVSQEFLEPSMNIELMRSLAERTGGKFYTARSTGSLVDDIFAHRGFAPRSIETRRDFPLWSLPWILAAALAAFSTEWFLRKRSGML